MSRTFKNLRMGIVFFTILLILNGCAIGFEKPILNREITAVFDKQFLGKWTIEKNDQAVVFSIVDIGNGAYKITGSDPKKAFVFNMLVSRSDGISYFNVDLSSIHINYILKNEKSSELPIMDSGYAVFKYSITTEGVLSVIPIDMSVVKNDVALEQFEGSLSKGCEGVTEGQSGILVNSMPCLIDFDDEKMFSGYLLTNDARLFKLKDKVDFKREG